MRWLIVHIVQETWPNTLLLLYQLPEYFGQSYHDVPDVLHSVRLPRLPIMPLFHSK